MMTSCRPTTHQCGPGPGTLGRIVISSNGVWRVPRRHGSRVLRPSFARSLVPKLTGLTRDLAAYLRFYNEERAHTGRLTRGRTPQEALVGARKMRPR